MTEKREMNKVAKFAEPGMLKNLSNQARLVFRLLRDRRVNFLVKLFPIGALVYLLSPDLFPFIIDDAGVLGVGLYLFLELCPADVVEEHRTAIWGEFSPEAAVSKEEIIDTEFVKQEKE